MKWHPLQLMFHVSRFTPPVSSFQLPFLGSTAKNAEKQDTYGSRNIAKSARFQGIALQRRGESQRVLLLGVKPDFVLVAAWPRWAFALVQLLFLG